MIIQELIALLGFKVEGQQQLEGFERSLKRTEGSLGSLVDKAVKFGAVAGAALSAAGFGLLKLARDAAGPLDDMVKMADRAGVSFEAFQELGFAAGQSGSSIGELGSTLAGLSARLSEAARGQGAARRALQAYGLSATDAAGRVKQADEFLLELADKFERLDEAQALDLARKLGIGPGLVTLLRSGRDEIDKLRKQARQAGLVFTEEEARKAEEFNDALSVVMQTLESFRRYIGVAILPTMTSIITRTQDWLDANNALVKQNIGDWVQRFSIVVERSGERAIQALGALGGAVARVATALTGQEIGTDTGLLLAMALIVARRYPVVAAITAIAAAIDDVWTAMEGGDSYTKRFLDNMDAIAAKSKEIGRTQEEVKFDWLTSLMIDLNGGLGRVSDFAIAWDRLTTQLSDGTAFAAVGAFINDYIISPIQTAIEWAARLVDTLGGLVPEGMSSRLQSLDQRAGEVSLSTPVEPPSSAEAGRSIGSMGAAAARSLGGAAPGGVVQNNEIRIDQTFTQGAGQSTADMARAGTRAGALDLIRQLGTVGPSPAQ